MAEGEPHKIGVPFGCSSEGRKTPLQLLFRWTATALLAVISGCSAGPLQRIKDIPSDLVPEVQEMTVWEFSLHPRPDRNPVLHSITIETYFPGSLDARQGKLVALGLNRHTQHASLTWSILIERGLALEPTSHSILNALIEDALGFAHDHALFGAEGIHFDFILVKRERGVADRKRFRVHSRPSLHHYLRFSADDVKGLEIVFSGQSLNAFRVAMDTLVHELSHYRDHRLAAESGNMTVAYSDIEQEIQASMIGMCYQIGLVGRILSADDARLRFSSLYVDIPDRSEIRSLVDRHANVDSGRAGPVITSHLAKLIAADILFNTPPDLVSSEMGIVITDETVDRYRLRCPKLNVSSNAKWLDPETTHIERYGLPVQ